jgi:hypothetical protein
MATSSANGIANGTGKQTYALPETHKTVCAPKGGVVAN